MDGTRHEEDGKMRKAETDGTARVKERDFCARSTMLSQKELTTSKTLLSAMKIASRL